MDWVQSWASEASCACVEGRGAADAWLRQAAELEKAEIAEAEASGGVGDLDKFYDLLVRPLLYVLAEKTGIDRRFLDA